MSCNVSVGRTMYDPIRGSASPTGLTECSV